MHFGAIRRFLIGNPIETQHLEHEKLNKRRGLAVLASDALSSTAYATEQILIVVMAAGAAGLGCTLPISIAIAALILIVGISYIRTIHAYPHGGGGYTVSRENLGINAGLVAGASLLVDYCLTVAVSICAGVAALTSAVPQLRPFQVEIALLVLAFVAVVNLRGLRESSFFFAFPTYAFIFIYGGMLAFGAYKIFSGDILHATAVLPTSSSGFQALGLFLILQGFASGASALTGIEAVSNGVQAFEPPQAHNATIVLVLMVTLLGTFFLGTSYLANYMGIVPNDSETVASQIAHSVFGSSFFYYAVQLVTGLILVLAANTAYTDFPRLSSILAQDRFLPRQLANLGDRLVFSNGILVLSGFVALLIVAFRAQIDALIPLYMIGVFVTFTLSQFGMVRYWYRHRSEEKHWLLYLFINGTGATCTAVVSVVVLAVKFLEGAWITFLSILGLIYMMKLIHRHYEEFKVQISLTEYAKMPKPYTGHKVIIPVSDVHRGVLEAARYALSMSNDVHALYVDLGNPERMEGMKREWNKWVPQIALEVLPSPYRSVIQPLIQYLDNICDSEGQDTAVTIVIPEFVPVKWWHQLLHNQTALLLRFALLFHRQSNRRYKVLAGIPYYLRR